MVETCAASGVAAARREGHPGCWVDPDGPRPRKIGALGIRVERGVSYHGIALNVDPVLADFDLIDACGMPDVISTSIALEAGRPVEAPSTAAVESAGQTFAAAFARAIGVELQWVVPAAILAGAGEGAEADAGARREPLLAGTR
jgi:lipoate-protein ligase B